MYKLDILIIRVIIGIINIDIIIRLIIGKLL